MSNHVHLVIRVEPELTYSWTDQQVAERGVALHWPAKYSDQLRQNRIAAWRMNPDKLTELRLKLGSLSSFDRGGRQQGRWLHREVLGGPIQVPALRG